MPSVGSHVPFEVASLLSPFLVTSTVDGNSVRVHRALDLVAAAKPACARGASRSSPAASSSSLALIAHSVDSRDPQDAAQTSVVLGEKNRGGDLKKQASAVKAMEMGGTAKSEAALKAEKKEAAGGGGGCCVIS